MFSSAVHRASIDAGPPTNFRPAGEGVRLGASAAAAAAAVVRRHRHGVGGARPLAGETMNGSRWGDSTVGSSIPGSSDTRQWLGAVHAAAADTRARAEYRDESLASSDLRSTHALLTHGAPSNAFSEMHRHRTSAPAPPAAPPQLQSQTLLQSQAWQPQQQQQWPQQQRFQHLQQQPWQGQQQSRGHSQTPLQQLQQQQVVTELAQSIARGAEVAAAAALESAKQSSYSAWGSSSQRLSSHEKMLQAAALSDSRRSGPSLHGEIMRLVAGQGGPHERIPLREDAFSALAESEAARTWSRDAAAPPVNLALVGSRHWSGRTGPTIESVEVPDRVELMRTAGRGYMPQLPVGNPEPQPLQERLPGAKSQQLPDAESPLHGGGSDRVYPSRQYLSANAGVHPQHPMPPQHSPAPTEPPQHSPAPTEPLRVSRGPDALPLQLQHAQRQQLMLQQLQEERTQQDLLQQQVRRQQVELEEQRLLLEQQRVDQIRLQELLLAQQQQQWEALQASAAAAKATRDLDFAAMPLSRVPRHESLPRTVIDEPRNHLTRSPNVQDMGRSQRTPMAPQQSTQRHNVPPIQGLGAAVAPGDRPDAVVLSLTAAPGTAGQPSRATALRRMLARSSSPGRGRSAVSSLGDTALMDRSTDLTNAAKAAGPGTATYGYRRSPETPLRSSPASARDTEAHPPTTVVKAVGARIHYGAAALGQQSSGGICLCYRYCYRLGRYHVECYPMQTPEELVHWQLLIRHRRLPSRSRPWNHRRQLANLPGL